jgi:hypothetical protein
MKGQIRRLTTAIFALLILASASFAGEWTDGDLTVLWEDSPDSAAAVNEQFDATATGIYDPNLPAGTEWEYTTVDITFEWEAKPDGNLTAGRQPMGGSGGGVSYKSEADITYPTASTTQDDKTVRVRAHVTGSILDYGADGEKGTGDDVTYTIDEWSQWLEGDLTIFSVLVHQSSPVFQDGSAMAIVAGGSASDSEVHRATLSVGTFVGGTPLSGVDLSLSIRVEDHKEVGPSFEGSDQVTTDTTGWADAVLLSGDAVCEVDIDVEHNGYAVQTLSVSTEEGARGADLWSFDPPYLLAPGSTSEVSLSLLRSGDGEPMDGHNIVFYLEAVELPDGSMVTEGLDAYASFSGDSVTTDNAGTATDTLTAGADVGQCEVIYVTAQDQNVWKRGSPLHRVKRTNKTDRRLGLRFYNTNTLDEVLDWTDIKIVPAGDNVLYVGLNLKAEDQDQYDALDDEINVYGYRANVEEENLPADRPSGDDLETIQVVKWKYDAVNDWACYRLKNTADYGWETGLPVTYFGDFEQDDDGVTDFFGIDNAHISTYGTHEPNMYYWGEQLLGAGLVSRGIAHPDEGDDGSNNPRKAEAGHSQNGSYCTGRPETSSDLELVQSGGVEKIVLTLRQNPFEDDWKYPGLWADMTHVLVKNQADIFLVSGHGNHAGRCSGDWDKPDARFVYNHGDVSGHWTGELEWYGMALCFTADYDGGPIGCADNTEVFTAGSDSRPGLDWAELVIGDLNGHGVFGFAGYGWSGRDYADEHGQDFGEELFGQKLAGGTPVPAAWFDSWAPEWTSFAKTASFLDSNGKSKWPAVIAGKRAGADGYYTDEKLTALEDAPSDGVKVKYSFRMDGYAQMYTDAAPFETYENTRGETADEKNSEMSRQVGVWDALGLDGNRPYMIREGFQADGNNSPTFKSGGDYGTCGADGAVSLSWTAPGHPDGGTALAAYQVQIFRKDIAEENRDWAPDVRGPDLTKADVNDDTGLVGTYNQENPDRQSVTIPDEDLQANDTRHFWRVRAKDENGLWGHWSAFHVFDKQD